MQKHTRAHAYVHMQKHTRAHSHTHTRPATVLLLCPSCFIAQLCSQSFSARDGSAIHYTPMDATPPAQRPQQTASAAGTERRENPFKSVAPEVHEFVRRSYPSSLSSTTTSTAVTAANADCRSPQDAERCLPLPPPTDAEWLKTPVLRGAAGWPAQPLRRPTLEFECLVQAYRGCLQRGEGILFADDACTVRFSRTLKECGALFSLKVDNASQAGPLSQVQLRLDDDKEVLAGAVVSLEPPSGFTGELGVGRSAAYCGELQARGPYEAPPVVTLSFRLWDASLAAVKLRLPLPVSALMRPLRLSAREFAGLWTAPAFQSSEEPVAFEGSKRGRRRSPSRRRAWLGGISRAAPRRAAASPGSRPRGCCRCPRRCAAPPRQTRSPPRCPASSACSWAPRLGPSSPKAQGYASLSAAAHSCSPGPLRRPWWIFWRRRCPLQRPPRTGVRGV
eukprot:GHVU01229679.1.p1 GENE.GHVU01229679.1~~GHVU01229679.1.p1  ORF type:complete len:448 (-),score=44.67 GHVU01229679.1:286-1629(-)